MGIASMVIGIIGLILAFMPMTSMMGIIFSLVTIVLGAVGRNGSSPGAAAGGLVCGILGLLFSVIFFFACGGAAACALM